MRTVTALRATRGARVVVELDERPWRVVPASAILEAGLTVGHPLERAQARILARALRRDRAEGVTVRSLARRDRSRSELEARLARAGVRESDRQEALDRAARTGLVDDRRFARARAGSLAERGAGDALILADLARHGVDEGTARAALSEVAPESARATRIVEERGGTAKTLRYLAARGFGDESVEGLVAELENRALP